MNTKREKRLEELFDRLWPIPRSITGSGFRKSLDILGEILPATRHKFPTGDSVFDWKVPKEWEPKEAYFIDPNGKKHAVFSENNLHLLNYSIAFSGIVSLEVLKEHLYSLPDMPDAIPYLTSYYEDRWGFCISHKELESLPVGEYKVHIDTKLIDGSVEIAEAVLEGESGEEILFSSYLCHPSLANNELSGPLVLTFLYELVALMPVRRYTYRFVIVPETIGSLCFLKLRGSHLKSKLIAGYQITCIGDPGKFTYKLSRQEGSLPDRVAKTVLKNYGAYNLRNFNPAIGSDERQYCSPGFDLPVGSLMRTMYTEYAEYHTSMDNKEFINFTAMSESVDAYFDIVGLLEANYIWKNTVMFGEPQLGRRGFFSTLGSQIRSPEVDLAMWWVLNLADGTNDLIEISERSNINWKTISLIAEKLVEGKLLEIMGKSK
ncbi:MAG: DUF4910 domain-containing protein [Gammaproteobacteria bacterium]|nr:DUF4910 domain-containing protein [Gammaproteobacteria bacterium]